MIFKLDRWATKDMFLLWKFEKLIKQKSCLFFFFCVSQASGGNARRVGYYTREEKGGKKLLQQTYSYLKRTSGPACLILKKDWKKKENFSCFSNTISNPPGAVVAFKFSAPFTLTIKLNYQLSNKYFLVEIGYMILILNVPAVIERSISSSESIMCRVTVRKIVTNY